MKKALILFSIILLSFSGISQTTYNLNVNRQGIYLTTTATGTPIYKALQYDAIQGISTAQSGYIWIYTGNPSMDIQVKRSLLAHYNGAAVPASDTTIAGEIYRYYSIWDKQKGKTKIVSKQFTRATLTPAAYQSGDVVCNSVVAPGVDSLENVVLTKGGGGWLSRIKLAIDTPYASSPQFRIHFYNIKPAAIADNAPLALVYAQQTGYIDYVDITLGIEGAGGDCSFGTYSDKKISYTTISNRATGKNIYYVIEAKGTITPKRIAHILVEATCTDIY